jgi:hypothetical protein
LIVGSFVLPGRESAEPIIPNWAAAMVVAAAPTKWRRGWSICSEFLGVSIMSLPTDGTGRLKLRCGQVDKFVDQKYDTETGRALL